MKKAVIYGAGNIGRGFIGMKLSEAGYEICFIDVNKEIVRFLNHDKEYPVKIISNTANREKIVNHVCAVSADDAEAVLREITEADIMATAVGVNALPHIIKPLSEGIKRRKEQEKSPLDIIICENLIDADKYFKKLVLEEVGKTEAAWLNQNIGFVKASIGRMVPIMTEEMKEGNPLKVWAEPYDELQIDPSGFRGSLPQLKHTVFYAPFDFYIKRKLFIHNLGHAAAAYLGWQRGYRYIYESVEDPEVIGIVQNAMEESARALYMAYRADNINMEDLNVHVCDLIRRFGNRYLGDTVERVGRDPIRKLSHHDRLVGAALFCLEQQVVPINIIKGIAAGLQYVNTNDLSSQSIQKKIRTEGIENTILSICGIERTSPLFKMVIRQYNKTCI